MLHYLTMGKRIERRRKELGLTQNTLAEMLQISNNHLSTIETGKGNASLELFCKICEVLNVTPDYLLIGEVHTNDVPGNITDMLSHCTDEDLALVHHIVEYLLLRHQNKELARENSAKI